MFTLIALVIALLLAPAVGAWAILVFFAGLIIDLLIAILDIFQD